MKYKTFSYRLLKLASDQECQFPPYYTILGRRAEKQHDERDDGQTIYIGQGGNLGLGASLMFKDGGTVDKYSGLGYKLR